MDINKVQKLNEMAHELKRHNIYNNSDAVSQAEKIYGSDNNYAKESAAYPSGEADELRKDVRKLTVAMQQMINEIKDLKLRHEKLEKELNDARVGMASRPRGEAQQRLAGAREAERDLNKPIDRNNVAPSEISVEKFFYYGNK